VECIDRLGLGSYVRILCDWSDLVCVNRVERVIVGVDYVRLCSVANRNSGFCSLQFCSGMRVPF